MIGAGSNVDIEQLANCIELAALCNRILAENPHWEHGPCHLAMKTWCDEAGDISAKLDHINPASWHGNVAVKSMVLLTCWENGCSMTVRELKALGYPAPFKDMDKGEGFDMFCPFGNNNMVLLGTPTEGEREEDEEEIAMATTMRQPKGSIKQSTPSADCVTADDIEALSHAELSNSLSQDSEPLKIDAYVMVMTSSNKEIQQHKGAACCIFSENLTIKEAQTRLEHVRSYERHGPTISTSTTFGSKEGDSSKPLTDIQDPAIILVHTHKLIWLAVVEIYKIKKGGVLVDKIASRLLSEPNVRVTVKVLLLKLSNDEDSQRDWHWFVGFEKLMIELPG